MLIKRSPADWEIREKEFILDLSCRKGLEQLVRRETARVVAEYLLSNGVRLDELEDCGE